MTDLATGGATLTAPVMAITSDDKLLLVADDTAELLRHIVQELIDAPSGSTVFSMGEVEWFDAKGRRLRLRVSDGDAVQLRLEASDSSIPESELAERVDRVLEAARGRLADEMSRFATSEDEVAAAPQEQGIPQRGAESLDAFLAGLSSRLNTPGLSHDSVRGSSDADKPPHEHRKGWLHNLISHG